MAGIMHMLDEDQALMQSLHTEFPYCGQCKGGLKFQIRGGIAMLQCVRFPNLHFGMRRQGEKW